MILTIIGVLLGTMTSAYISLIFTRWNIFQVLKFKAISASRKMEYIDNKVWISNQNEWIWEMTSIASDLFYLGHWRAGDDVNEIKNIITDVLKTKFKSNIDVLRGIEITNLGVQVRARYLKPNYWAIFLWNSHIVNDDKNDDKKK